MSLLAAIPYDLFTFGPFELPWLSGFMSENFGIPLKIHSFGLFVAVGLLLCLSLASKRGEEKLGVDGEEVQNFGIYLIGIGWVFSHFFNVLFYEPEKVLADPMELFKFWGSISSYGGLFGGIIAAWIWRIRNQDKDFLEWCDLAAWGLTFAWFFGRVGCASVHDHPGAETDFFLAISGWPDGTTRHDLGLYEAIWWSVICVTVWLLDKKPRPTGFFLALVPMMYAPARFTFDFLRVGPEQGGDLRYLPEILPGNGWTPAQFFSIGIFIVGLYFWKRTKDGEPMQWRKWPGPGGSSSDSTASGADEEPELEDAETADSDEPKDRKKQHRRKKKKK